MTYLCMLNRISPLDFICKCMPITKTNPKDKNFNQMKSLKQIIRFLSW